MYGMYGMCGGGHRSFELSSFPCRPVSCFEHSDILEESLSTFKVGDEFL